MRDKNTQNKIELYDACELAMRIAPKVVIHKKETIPANNNIILFEKNITDYDFSTTEMLLVTSLGTSDLGTDNTRIVWDRDYTPQPFRLRPEEETLDFQVGTPNIPYDFVTWTPIYYEHKMTAFNDAASEKTVEILMYSFIFPKGLWDVVLDKFFKKSVEIY